MQPLRKHPYNKVSASGDFNEEEDADTSTTPFKFKMISGIMIGTLAFVAIAWFSYSLTSVKIGNHNLPPSSSSSTTIDFGNTFDDLPSFPSSAPSTIDFEHTFFEKSPIDISSSFESHWPDFEIPDWATKKINYDIPKEQEICFIHVGKAGGSTVGCSLGFSLHCDDDHRGMDNSVQIEQIEHLSKSLLAKLTTHTFHKDVYDCDDDSGYFLFVIRDPIVRALSAFNYDRPGDDDFKIDSRWASRKSHFYMGCPFYHMEDFVQNGLREEGEASDRCKRWAVDSLQGINVGNYESPEPEYEYNKSPDHWYFNYQYYFEAIPSVSKILAIRNEHIEEDIRSIENSFGCHEQERLALAKSMNKNTWSDPADLYLSEESISILCKDLCNEIQIYKKILYRALNISPDQLRMSMMDLEAKCPEEATAEDCSDAMPDISEKVRDNRGY